MTLLKSTGILQYHPGHKLVLQADQGLCDYYRALIPKYYNIKKQKYHAHISTVRKEIPPNLQFWGKYEGEKIEFNYLPYIHIGSVYAWLNVFCSRLEEIRVELGLEISSQYTLPPEGFVRCFHMTLGNNK